MASGTVAIRPRLAAGARFAIRRTAMTSETSDSIAATTSPTELRAVMYDLPYPVGGRTRQVDPCPLSGREVEVLKRLAEGKVYKQIAHELQLSTSTVRTHLHNIYGKLGAVDRAQAVLIATERGWL